MCVIERHFFHIDIDNFSLIGCEDIEVTSDLDIQKCRTGIYKIQQQVFNQKPVFKHETKEEYLFYMKKGKGFWMVNELFDHKYFSTFFKVKIEFYL